jgi:hypothetical protein
VSTPRRMSGVASRALSSQALPATPSRIATRARPAVAHRHGDRSARRSSGAP